MTRLTGIGVSPGLAVGRAVILIQREHGLRYRVAASRVGHELDRLERSRAESHEQLEGIRARIARLRGPELAALFDAQLLMLDDPMLVPRAAALVREARINAEWAVQRVSDEFSAVFDEIADPYLRERKGDLVDVAGRLQMNLRPGSGTPRDLLREIEEPAVLIADELTPSLAAQVDWGRIRGFATDAGSRTYHTAILARSLDVPAVVGLHEATRAIQPGQMVVVDGDASELVLDPDEALLARVARNSSRPVEEDTAPPGVPAVTTDGVRIRIEANIEFPDDMAAARSVGAEGIGLYRSEFLLAGAGDALDEEAQYHVYRRLLEGMAPDPVTVRTFDIDVDQLAVQSDQASLWETADIRGSRQGLRGLRLSLARPELFEVQVRALLRAARHGALRILFPFVSSVEQVREARRLVTRVAADLERGGEAVPTVPVGVMIEIPGAAVAAGLLAREVDFFTIGTNDLIQYCLAVDRTDERVSRFYEPLHPAVLRIVLLARRAASRRGIPVSLCGEMAADPALLPLLLGLGLTDFSMTPGAVRMAKQVIAEVSRADMRALARQALRLSTAEEIEQHVTAALGRQQVRT